MGVRYSRQTKFGCRKSMNLIVVTGAGYIGRHTAKLWSELGTYAPVGERYSGDRREPDSFLRSATHDLWKYAGIIDTSLRFSPPRLIAVQHYRGCTRACAFKPFAILNG